MGPTLVAAGLVVYNTLANKWRPFQGWAYVPMNLGLTAATLGLAIGGFGLDGEDLGISWANAWVGAAIGAVAIIPAFGALAFERGRGLLRDRRLEGVRGNAAAYVLALRIPAGTALAEEVLFRGVLLGAWLSSGRAQAVVASSIAFGLWHIGPTVNLARANRMTALVVPAGVIATGAAGAFLAWLRLETGSLGAPFLTHALVNSGSAAAALIALSRRKAA